MFDNFLSEVYDDLSLGYLIMWGLIINSKVKIFNEFKDYFLVNYLIKLYFFVFGKILN